MAADIDQDREYELRLRELEIRISELRMKRWSNPLMVAVIAGAVTLAGHLITTDFRKSELAVTSARHDNQMAIEAYRHENDFKITKQRYEHEVTKGALLKISKGVDDEESRQAMR